MSVRKSWVPRTVIALLTVPAVLLVTVVPASAERMTWTDQRQDVWYDGGRGPEDAHISPHIANGDIARVSVRHRRHAVVVRMAFYDLRAGRDTETGADVAPAVVFRTNEGLLRQLRVFWYGRGTKFVQFVNWVPFEDVACNITATRDLVRDTMYLRVPRRCLSRPRWIQASVGSTQSDEQSVGEYTDDAHSGSQWTQGDGPWTRRLHRAAAIPRRC